jgi:hypothetical protein
MWSGRNGLEHSGHRKWIRDPVGYDRLQRNRQFQRREYERFHGRCHDRQRDDGRRCLHRRGQLDRLDDQHWQLYGRGDFWRDDNGWPHGGRRLNGFDQRQLDGIWQLHWHGRFDGFYHRELHKRLHDRRRWLQWS